MRTRRPQTALLESAAELIPQQILLRIPEEAYPSRTSRGGQGNPHRGGQRHRLAPRRDWQLIPRPRLRGQPFDGFLDPWEDYIIEECTLEWRRATAIMDSVCKLTDWLQEDLPSHLAEMQDFVLYQ